MIEAIERELKSLQEFIEGKGKDPNNEKLKKAVSKKQYIKYINQAKRKHKKLKKELDKIYAMHAKANSYGKKVCKEFEIEYF